MLRRSTALVFRRTKLAAFVPARFSTDAPAEAPPVVPTKRVRPAPWRTQDPNGPTIYKLHSQKEFLEAGETVWWCSCGLSKEQPWCDGSHEGTSFEPVEWTVPETRMYSICLCKYSEKGHICDGMHKEFIGYTPPVRKAT